MQEAGFTTTPQDTKSKNCVVSAAQGTPPRLLTFHMQITTPLARATLSNVTTVLMPGRGSGAPSGRLAHGTRAPEHRLPLTDPSHQAASSGRSEKYSAFGPGGIREERGGKIRVLSVYWRHPS